MEQSKQKISSVGRDNINQTGDKNKVAIDNRRGTQGKGWLNTLMGKVVVGVIIGVAVALIVAYFKIQP